MDIKYSNQDFNERLIYCGLERVMLNIKNYGPEDEDDDWVEELDFFDLMDED